MCNQSFRAGTGMIQAVILYLMCVLMWGPPFRRAVRLAFRSKPARGSWAWWMRENGGLRKA